MPLIHKRIGLLFAAFLVLLAVAGLKATWMGTVKASSLGQAATTQQVERLTVPAPRGAILDRHGNELAVSEPAADIAVTPYLIKDATRAARRLAPLVNATEDEVLRKLARRDTGFVYLARQLRAERVAAIEELELPGLQIIPRTRRAYPRLQLASQLLGGVGIDGKGLGGLEYRRDEVLHGTDGVRRMTKDALDRPIAVQDVVETRPGKTLRLSIDAAIQGKVEAVLGAAGAKFRPKGATAIVMDPRNGEVLAMANWPRVDANAPSAAPDYARQNRAVGFDYEPGSTFKAFTIAGALEERAVTPETSFTVPPQIQVADRTIGESHPRGTEQMTTSQILAKSSNVGSIMIGRNKLGSKRFDAWIRRFGFGSRTGVDLPGEERGQILPLERYSGSSMGNLPIGQGITVTPMQIATAYSAIANGGILRPARVVRSIGDEPTPLAKGRRVIQRSTSRELRTMLEGVFGPGGTASEVVIPGYQLAGKTGTANKVDRKTGLYSESQYIASFVGFAPAREPKLLAAVMVDEPNGAIYGAEVAAPAFRDIMAFALPYLGIAPD